MLFLWSNYYKQFIIWLLQQLYVHVFVMFVSIFRHYIICCCETGYTIAMTLIKRIILLFNCIHLLFFLFHIHTVKFFLWLFTISLKRKVCNSNLEGNTNLFIFFPLLSILKSQIITLISLDLLLKIWLWL